jgi:hypothetical protein
MNLIPLVEFSRQPKRQRGLILEGELECSLTSGFKFEQRGRSVKAEVEGLPIGAEQVQVPDERGAVDVRLQGRVKSRQSFRQF